MVDSQTFGSALQAMYEFDISLPDFEYFGEKSYQLIIRLAFDRWRGNSDLKLVVFDVCQFIFCRIGLNADAEDKFFAPPVIAGCRHCLAQAEAQVGHRCDYQYFK